MKIKLSIALLFVSMLAAFGQTLTPFYYQGYMNGQPQTNPIIFTPYFNPSAQPSGIVINGTNVYSDSTFTVLPNSNGFVVTNITANSYRVTIPALGVVFYANIPNISAPTNSLGLYITNQPVVTGPIAGFNIATNLLGYWPATNTYAGVVAALGYIPSTNGVPLITVSNPTNSFNTNTIYTAPAYKSLLSGFTLGGILYFTNIGVSYQIPVTNNFSQILSTNATWSLLGVSLTNCVDWGNP